MTGKVCISDIECSVNGAALRLGAGYEVFSDDAKFDDLIRQLREARELVLENGKKLAAWAKAKTPEKEAPAEQIK